MCVKYQNVVVAEKPNYADILSKLILLRDSRAFHLEFWMKAELVFYNGRGLERDLQQNKCGIKRRWIILLIML